MSEQKTLTCIGCPVGCPLQLTHEGREIIEIEGHACNRGQKYARQEFTDPKRSISTTVRISGARWQRVPVKVTKPIPKDRIMEAARLIHKLQLTAPVKNGQVLIDNFLGDPSVAVVVCKSMEVVS